MTVAGTIGLLSDPTDEPLENYHDSGFRAIHVEETQSTFDGGVVQSGQIAGRVPDTKQTVTLSGHRITTERRETSQKVATDWVADVAGAGWVCAESTHPTDAEHEPPWPFSAFETRTGREIEPVAVDPGAFARAQEDAGRDTVVEYVGRSEGDDSVSIEWGKGATQSRATSADVGVALTTFWDGAFVRVIVYASGFVAVWEPEDWSASAFARFVSEEVLPVAYIPEDDEDTDQQTLQTAADGGQEWTAGTCEDCGHDRERTRVVGGERRCIVCLDGGSA